MIDMAIIQIDNENGVVIQFGRATGISMYAELIAHFGRGHNSVLEYNTLLRLGEEVVLYKEGWYTERQYGMTSFEGVKYKLIQC